MGKQLYHIDQTKKSRKPYFIKVGAIFLLILTFFGAGYIYLDIQRSDDIDDSANRPIAGSIKPKQPTRRQVGGPAFSMNLPKSWVEHQAPPFDKTPYTWRDNTPTKQGRVIEVFVDTLPNEYHVTRLLPITVSGHKITPGVVSGQCYGWTSDDGSNPDYAESKWDEVPFRCDLHRVKNVIGTGVKKVGMLAPVTGKSGALHRYHIRYTEHTDRPDYEPLTQAILTFEAK